MCYAIVNKKGQGYQLNQSDTIWSRIWAKKGKIGLWKIIILYCFDVYDTIKTYSSLKVFPIKDAIHFDLVNNRYNIQIISKK